jgi:hypothetical protein
MKRIFAILALLTISGCVVAPVGYDPAPVYYQPAPAYYAPPVYFGFGYNGYYRHGHRR